MKLEAHITPAIIRWARQRIEISEEELASRASGSLTRAPKWESGEARPTFRQARTLAKELRIPFGYLFLNEPPQEPVPIPDLRTVRNKETTRLSPDFIDVLYDALRKQDWYREHLRDEEFEPLPFIGRFTLSSRPELVARDIQVTLGVDNALRRSVSNWKEFLHALVRRAEENRILVLRSSVVGNNTSRQLSVREFRGFALCDAMAPLIFINSRDALAAQIFTLVHELAHLWVGESGISNPLLRARSSEEKSNVEKFCNQTAAEVLVPAAELRKEWNPHAILNEQVERAVRKYRVSSIVVLRRALDLELIGRETFFKHYDLELEKQKPIRKSRGGDPYATFWTRNSRRFTEALTVSALEGGTLYRDAARLLGVKVKTLSSLAQKLAG